MGVKTKLPSTVDIITHLFVQVDDQLTDVGTHPLSKLHPSEIVTIGMLFGLKGTGFKAFYRWLSRDYSTLFPTLPERSRLSRLITQYAALCADFLGKPSFFVVMDSYPIELIHPKRQGRAKRSLAKKSKDKGRWSVGIKWCCVLNDLGEVVNFGWMPMNCHDQVFYPLAQGLNDQAVVMADWGFRSADKSSIPSSLKLCKKGTWNVRMQVETALSLVTRVMHLKHLDHRRETYLTAHLAYVSAVFNLLLAWSRELFGWKDEDAFKMHIASFSL